MNFGPVTPEFKKGKYVDTYVDQQFGYVRLAAPLLDLTGISTEFFWTISTQFCFSYSIGGVTAMQCGLHAGICHVFVVFK